MNPDQQVLCSTHSSHFVSRNTDDIPAIARLSRNDHGTVTIAQINAEVWNEIVDANQALNTIASKWPKLKKKLEEDDLKPEMEAVKYFLWLNPDRSSIFFANHVLLVEGTTEVALINKLISDEKINNADCGLYVLDCLGKYNIHRFMNLLKHLKVPHSVLYDDDNDKDEHAELNQLIEASKNSSTLCVKQIAGDLESMLGIPFPKSAHRKPQHVLYLYSTEQIDQERIDEFCSLVASCLPAKPSP